MTDKEFRHAASAEFGRKPDIGDSRATDLGTAELFVRWHGEGVRYCHPWKSWLVWDGKRWSRDEHGAVNRLAVKTVKRLYREAATEPDDKERQRLAGWAIAYEKRDRLESLLSLARNDGKVIVRPDELDVNPFLLTCSTGTIDLRTGKQQPHNPSDLITRLASVDFDAAEKAPCFEKFLSQIFAGDGELMRFVRRAAGYSLTADITEQCLIICHGSGANGKSTLMSILQEMLGDYAMTTPAETLLAKRDGGGIPNDLARLVGVRLVAASETEDGRRFAESRVKALSGGDKIAARFMRAEWFEFEPKFKLWLATNHKPEIRGADLAIWRRIRLVPFAVTIPPKEQDPHLLDTLRAELPGIFSWAVRGCLEWQRRRLDPPAAVTSATTEYRSESDQLGRWIDERCVTGEGFEGKSSALYGDYKAWCIEAGENSITSQLFSQRLRDRGFRRRKTETSNVYERLGLVAQ